MIHYAITDTTTPTVIRWDADLTARSTSRRMVIYLSPAELEEIARASRATMRAQMTPRERCQWQALEVEMAAALAPRPMPRLLRRLRAYAVRHRSRQVRLYLGAR